jgi:hypothetical protein
MHQKYDHPKWRSLTPNALTLQQERLMEATSTIAGLVLTAEGKTLPRRLQMPATYRANASWRPTPQRSEAPPTA